MGEPTLKEMEDFVAEELKILLSGVEEVLPYEDFVKKLYYSKKENKPLRIKYGADPSAPDLHLGHTVPIKKLKQFQELGHHIIFIIGDFTARIGDPTGKSETRKALSKEQVEENAKTYLNQIFKILDRDKTEVIFNGTWFDKMTFSDVISLCSKYTVARMLERDDFAKRFKENKPIYIHEFLYPLAQGYDSVRRKADLELGGTDQKISCIVGRIIQKEYEQEPQIIMTLPILEGLDGIQKMSKSLGNYVGITEPPEEMYGKIMSISDELMFRYYSLLLGYTDEEIKELKEAIEKGEKHPKSVKSELAKRIVAEYHSKEAAIKAEAHFEKIHKKKEIPDDIPEYSFNGKKRLTEIIVSTKIASSNGEAKRLIKGGGVYLDGNRISDILFEIDKGEHILKVGKRKFAKIIIN